jgi:hypothetical protein
VHLAVFVTCRRAPDGLIVDDIARETDRKVINALNGTMMRTSSSLRLEQADIERM